MVRGNLFVVAAASGTGKTSLVKALAESVNNLRVSVSYTTRQSRPNEISGVSYNFVSHQTFNEMVQAGDFLEHATVYGESYGTSRKWVENELAAGCDVILEIDWQGGRQIKYMFPASVLLFILPPSIASLRERLLARREDSDHVIESRLKAAREDMSHHTEYDYLIVNDDFDQALLDMRHIILAQRLTHARQVALHKNLLVELLENH